MSLTNTQYDELMRQYNQRQLKARHIQEEHRREALSAIPELAGVDEEIASLSVTCARRMLMEEETGGSAQLLDELRHRVNALSQKRAALLAAHGYPADYLEPAYTCPKCQDTGYVGSTRCTCFNQAAIDLFYTQSGLREILKEENFSTLTFRYYSEEMIDPRTALSARDTAKRVVEDCRRFIADFDLTHPNLFFYGNTGLGKTFLSHCIAKELIDSAHSVIYFSSFRLLELFAKTTFGKNEAFGRFDEREVVEYAYIFDCDLLILDDLGTELTNSFVATQLFLVINERLARKKSTIISTNLSLRTFASTYSERVFSRISSNYSMERLIGDDIRIQKKLGSRSRSGQ